MLRVVQGWCDRVCKACLTRLMPYWFLLAGQLLYFNITEGTTTTLQQQHLPVARATYGYTQRPRPRLDSASVGGTWPADVRVGNNIMRSAAWRLPRGLVNSWVIYDASSAVVFILSVSRRHVTRTWSAIVWVIFISLTGHDRS